MLDSEEIILSDEEVEEGLGQWKYMLVALVAGTKVTKDAMDKFINARWKQVAPPMVTKQAGIFLMRFNTEEDMNRIFQLPLNLIFDKSPFE